MKKLILIVALSAALLCLCVSMLGISWLSIRQIGISGETIPLVSVGAEATEEKILEVNSPATLGRQHQRWWREPGCLNQQRQYPHRSY